MTSLLLHFNANAQTAWVDVDYGEKIETIHLAKAGDADALFKLGLSHFNDAHSAQGLAIAERFFFHASEKGHDKAKQYLITLRNISGINPAHKSPVKSGDIKPESKIKTNKSIDEQTVASSIIGAPKYDRAKRKIKLNKFTDEQIIVQKHNGLDERTVVTLNYNETIPPVETSYVKVAANFHQNKLIESDVQSNNFYHPKRESVRKPIYKTIWMNTIKLLFFIAKILLFIIFLLVSAGFGLYLLFYINEQKSLPKDFNRKVYLTLNPDVKLAGVKAADHYILHGKREGRQYKH